MRIEEDRLLLKDQETDRRATIGSVDLILARREERAMARAQRGARMRQEEQRRVAEEAAIMEVDDSASTTSTDEGGVSPLKTRRVNTSPPRTRARKNIVSPDLAAALDRTNTSDRNATLIVAAAAASLGHDVSELSANTFRSSRRRNRSETAASIMHEVGSSGPGQLVVHWDSKILPALTGAEKMGRLAILVSGKDIPRPGETSQLLGFPNILSSTGEEEANSVVRTLKDWKLDERVVGMSYDTTPSNTGRRGRALR